MTDVLISRGRPAEFLRRLVRAGLLLALVVALAIGLNYISAERKCRGGAFSAGFGSGFNVKRCDLVIKGGGDVILRVEMAQ
jgi:hypothetical protein